MATLHSQGFVTRVADSVMSDSPTQHRSSRVLFVDDDPETCDLVREGLEARGYNVDVGRSSAEARELLAGETYIALVTDLWLEQPESGIALAEQAAEEYPDLAVVIVTGHGSMEAAIAALRVRVEDFVTKPIRLEELGQLLESIEERRRVRGRLSELEALRRESEVPHGERDDVAFIGSSSVVNRLRDFVSRVAPSDTSAFIHGESGTGKELIARMLHSRSPRAGEPFVAINCAAIPEGLLESELFGHVRGAFTGASRESRGLFMEANRGTLLLDEVGDLPLELQPKLLRALEQREVRPVGGTRSFSYDARLVTSTHRDLRQLVDSGQFREDLYYRINVVSIDVPPLRDRGDDVLELAQHFVRKYAHKQGKAVRGFTEEAALHLLRYSWPGNVRELENAMEQAVALTHAETLDEGDLPLRVRRRARVSGVLTKHGIPTLEQLETEHIEQVLSRTKGNKSQAARLLGIDRRTLHRKLSKLAEERV